MVEISTSVLSVKKENATKTFYDLEVAGTNYFHIDVMDGRFVENNTAELMKEYSTIIKHISNLPLDVHLMVKDVEKYIKEYMELSPNIITIHLESVSDKDKLKEYISLIKQNNIKVGLSIKPNTKIEEIYEYLSQIHMALIMTVEPGKGGQKIIIETLEKIKQLKEYINKNQIDLDIEADGGINIENAKYLKLAGADILVVGSAIISSNDYKSVIKKLQTA